MPLTVEQILEGTGTGRMQSVGGMSVIPLLGEEFIDESWSPPDLEAGTQNYGSVRVRNRSSSPTIVPTGSAFVTSECAQDHAVPGATMLKAGEQKDITNAYCIQETQGGLIKQAQRDFVILPASLRAQALANRTNAQYSAMWPHIRAFKKTMGLTGAGNLVEFLKRYEKELDQFVAEFECVPNQVGALVMIGDTVVGVERAPSPGFWEKLWVPLIRVCYGSLALKVQKSSRAIPAVRQPLRITSNTLSGIRSALKQASEATDQLVALTSETLGPLSLTTARTPDQTLSANKLLTVASQQYAGQTILNKDNRPIYASLTAAGV